MERTKFGKQPEERIELEKREMFVIVLPSFWRVLHAKPQIVRMSQFLDTHFFVLFLNTSHFFFLFLNTENAGSIHVLGKNDEGGTNDEFVLSVGSRKCLSLPQNIYNMQITNYPYKHCWLVQIKHWIEWDQEMKQTSGKSTNSSLCRHTFE